MLAYTYIEQGKFELREKPRPRLENERDAIVRVTLGSICTSDLHIAICILSTEVCRVPCRALP